MNTNSSSTHANAELLLVCRKTGSVQCTHSAGLCFVFQYVVQHQQQQRQRRIPPQQHQQQPTTITFHEPRLFHQRERLNASNHKNTRDEKSQAERMKHVENEKDKTN